MRRSTSSRLQQSGTGLEALARIAKAGRGSVIQTVDPATLTKTFQDEARNLTRQVLVTADVPHRPQDGRQRGGLHRRRRTDVDRHRVHHRPREAEARRCTGRTGPRADLLVHPDHADAGRRGVCRRPRPPRDRARDVDAAPGPRPSPSRTRSACTAPPASARAGKAQERSGDHLDHWRSDGQGHRVLANNRVAWRRRSPSGSRARRRRSVPRSGCCCTAASRWSRRSCSCCSAAAT